MICGMTRRTYSKTSGCEDFKITQPQPFTQSNTEHAPSLREPKHNHDNKNHTSY